MSPSTLSFALLLALAGCGSSAPGPSTFAAINAQTFQTSCGLMSCHSPEGERSSGHLDLKTDPYAALVGVVSDNAMAKAEGKLRVAPGNSADSFLYLKLTLPAGPSGACRQDKSGYGACMPQAFMPLDASTIEGIKMWIDKGAPKD